MNVIFLDFDGVLDTIHHSSNEDVENKIKILSDFIVSSSITSFIEASITTLQSNS